MALGAPLIAVKGFASAEVQAIFTRARELCGVLHATGDLFPVLFRLRSFHLVKGDIQTAYDLGKELVELARRVGDPDLLIEAYYALGAAIYYGGDFPSALEEFRRMETFYDADRHGSHAYLYGQEPGMACLAYQACALAYMGQTCQGSAEAASRSSDCREGQPPVQPRILADVRGMVSQRLRSCAAHAVLCSDGDHGRLASFALGLASGFWPLEAT